MNVPITATYTVGATLYAVITSPAGTFWNTISQTFEAFNAGNWAQYAVPMAEYPGTSYYSAAYPTGIAGVLTSELLFAQAGGSPALSDAPAFTVIQSQGKNVGAVGNLWQSAQNMAFSLGTQQLGAIVGTPVSSLVLPTNLTSTELDAYAGRAVIMTSGALAQQGSRINAYDNVLFTLTIVGFPSGGTPANTDTFVII